MVGSIAAFLNEHEVLDLLFGLILFASFIQPNARRFLIALFYSCSNLIHGILFKHFIPSNMFAYFSTAAIFDLLSILFICIITPIHKFNISMQRVCLMSIILNFTGYCMFRAGMNSDVYVIAFAGIYVWALYLLIKRDRLVDVGGFKLGVWIDSIDVNRITGFLHLQKYKGKI